MVLKSLLSVSIYSAPADRPAMRSLTAAKRKLIFPSTWVLGTSQRCRVVSGPANRNGQAVDGVSATGWPNIPVIFFVSVWRTLANYTPIDGERGKSAELDVTDAR
jgi:hypothetical protein